jgi:hypothetical protein
MKNLVARIAATLFAASTLSLAAVAPAHAGNSTSLGHGVKCTWVLVSQVGSNYSYKQVCRKGV